MKTLQATTLATLFLLLTSSYIENRGYDQGSLRPYMEKGRSYKDEAGFKKHQDETKELFTRAWETTEFQKMLLEAQGNFEGTESRKPTEAEENELEGEVRSIIAGWEIDLVRDLAKEYGSFKAREVSESDTDKGFLAGIFQKIKDFFAPELDKANAVSSDILVNDLSDWRSMVDAGTTTKVADQKKSLADYYDSLKTGSPLTGDALAAFLNEVDKKRASEEWAIDRISEMLKEQSFNEYAWRRALEEDIKKGGILVGGTIVRTNDAFLSGESPDKQMVALASGLRSDLDTGLSEILKETGYKLDRVDNAGIQITSLNAQYKKDVAAELERGLAKWNDAEDKLRRAYQEWAAKNDANYDQGVRLWQDAFNQFEAAHTAWQQKIGQQITDGDKMWDKAITRLQTEQANAQAELSQFMDEQSQNWSDYFGTLNNDLYSAVQLSAEIQKNRRGFVDLLKGISFYSKSGLDEATVKNLFGLGNLNGEIGKLDGFNTWSFDTAYQASSGTKNGGDFNFNLGFTRTGGFRSGVAEEDYYGDSRDRIFAHIKYYLGDFKTNFQTAGIVLGYDESRNQISYSGAFQYSVLKAVLTRRLDAITRAVTWETTTYEDAKNVSVGGANTLYGENSDIRAYITELDRFYFYQSQVSSLNTLGANVAETQSRLFGEYSALLNGSGASEGLFNPGVDNQNFYFRTAKEWELYRLEKDLAEAQQNLARKENIRNLSMTPSWSASAQADAETQWKDAEQKYNDAKTAYEAKKSEADTYYANAVTSHVSNMASLSSWLSAEGVRVGEANSNYFQAMDAYQDIVTNDSKSTSEKDAALAAFRVAQDTYTNAKAGYEASNAVFKTMRATKDDLMRIYYGLLGESDSLYGSMILADHDNQIKRDSFDTIKYVDYLDTNETQAAYLAAQASYDSLKTQRDAAAATVSGANVYDFFGDAANASLLATEKYKLSELAGWEGRAYQDLWGTEGNGFTSAGIQNFIASRSRGFDIGNQTGDYTRDLGSYMSGGNKVTTQLVALTGDTRYWSEDKWASNMIEVAVKGNNIPLIQNRTLHNGDMVQQVTTTSNTFLNTVTAVTNQVALTGGDWNVSIRYSSDVNQMLRDAYNIINGSFGASAVSLMVEGVTNLGLKWNDTKQSFMSLATNRIAGIRDELNANHSLIAQNVSNQIANGVDERKLYGDLSKYYLDNMQMVNGIYGTGNAFGSAQGYLSDLIPTLVTKNKVGQYQSQMDAYSRQINSVMADRDNWQNLIQKIQTKGENDWQKTYADMVSAFNDWNNRYAEDTYSAKVNWKAKNDDLNAHKYLWAQYATADITEGQRSAYFNELRSTMDAMIGDVLENLPKDVQGDTASLKTKDQALAKMESLIKVQLSQSLANRGDSINTLFANTEVGKLYFVGNQELHARLEKNMEDTERIALNLRNSQMFESVAQSHDAREKAINGMNISTRVGLEDQLKAQGYAMRGGEWFRHVVIDSHAGKDEYADQTVRAYQSHSQVDVPFSLTLQQILKETPEVASYMIERASKLITSTYERFMGKEGDFEANGDPKNSIYGSAEMFGHVGRAPEFASGQGDDPMRQIKDGYSQLGDITPQIRSNALAAARGQEALSLPWWKKKLWDDDTDNDGKPDKDKIVAPSISDVAKIVAAVGAAAVGIVATVATAGAAAAGIAAGAAASAAALAAGASTAAALAASAAATAAAVASAGALSLVGAAAIGAGMTFSVNAADTIATGAYYGKPPQEIALSVAKDAAISGVGILTAGIGSGITSTGSAIANMAIQTGVGALKGGINAGTGALVNALNINDQGNLGFDTSDKYWKGAGASMLMGVGSGAVAGLAGSIGMKDANGATMAGFSSKDVKVDGFLNGLLRSGISVAGKYAVENGVGALAYSWDHQGSFQGYSGTKFEWGNAMSTIAGEGLRSANLFNNGALNELLAYGGMKVGSFLGNSIQHGLAGEDLRTMKGIDLMGGLSASLDAGAIVRAFGHDFMNGGARDQDPASVFWQQGMESTWAGTTIFGMSADGSGLSGGFGNSHRGELNLAAIGAGMGQAVVGGVQTMQKLAAEEANKAKFRAWAERIEAEQKQREQNDAAREGTSGILGTSSSRRQGQIYATEAEIMGLSGDSLTHPADWMSDIPEGAATLKGKFGKIVDWVKGKLGVKTDAQAPQEQTGPVDATWYANQLTSQARGMNGQAIPWGMCGPTSFANALINLGVPFPTNMQPQDYVNNVLQSSPWVVSNTAAYNKDNGTSFEPRHLPLNLAYIASNNFGLKALYNDSSFQTSKGYTNPEATMSYYNSLTPSAQTQYMLGTGLTGSGHQVGFLSSGSNRINVFDPVGIPNFNNLQTNGFPSYQYNQQGLGNFGLGTNTFISASNAFRYNIGLNSWTLQLWKSGNGGR